MTQFWDHQFTKNGKEIQIGEEKFLDNTMRPIYAQPMHCVHCDKEYVQGRDPRPVGPCPARNDKREAKRLGVDLKDVRGER